MPLLKKIAARLPDQWQAELKRYHFSRQIAKGTFVTDEPEYALVPSLVKAGDWVIDIGANVGHYTRRFSDLVGPTGRVIAFEPVPATFALLAANVQLFGNANVTLVNAAASSRLSLTGMTMPRFDSGLTNYYEARLEASGRGEFSVLTLPVDCLAIDRRIALVKIDTEGHEAAVLEGMQSIIAEHRPVLIVETGSRQVTEFLAARSYAPQVLPGSPNVVFRPES